MSASVLLTHSYFLAFDPKERSAMMPYAPLGTLYAASALRSEGHRCALFDAMLAKDEQELLPVLERENPDFVVIYDDDFNYLTKMCLGRMRQAAFTMSGLAKEAGCTVIVHGSDPADHAEAYLDHGADYVVVGEGERTICELIKGLRLSKVTDPATIPGLVFRDATGLRRTVKRPVLTDLDQLPRPAWDLVDVERYRGAWRRHGYFSMNIVTTRGCPFHCNWCAKPIYGQVYHSRSPECVVEEMLWLRSAYRPDQLWFCDDIFGLAPGWIASFADLVLKRDARMPFKCLSRADLLLRDDTVGHLARSGCRTVWIGAESGSQKILDAMEKGTTVDEIRRAAALLRGSGIRVGFFLQYGYPGETRADIDETLEMVRECRPDEIGVSVSYPLPGTPFHARVSAELGAKRNWVDSQDLDLMFAGTFSPDFYRALHTITHKKFSIWRGQEAARRMLTGPALSRRTIRSLLAMSYHAVTLPWHEHRLRRLEIQSGGQR